MRLIDHESRPLPLAEMSENKGIQAGNPTGDTGAQSLGSSTEKA